jgi:hypothetical protein
MRNLLLLSIIKFSRGIPVPIPVCGTVFALELMSFLLLLLNFHPEFYLQGARSIAV